ncbi:MAG: Peptide/nickel transport system substrate-binding protein [Marmoricola sp.]|jgi:peptide/nickel transport system substrate-binding protein|nr:Peptide/nickel transport system substrate-binding protein [Marmoricola sp.]
MRTEHKKNHRLRNGIIVLALACLVLTGCSSSPSNGGSAASTLVVAISADPPTLDVQTSTTNVTQQIGYNIYEGLFAPDANFKPSPMLVDTYHYDEATKTYTFKLRAGVPFQNGHILDSGDVVASLDRWMKLSTYAQLVAADIVSIKATGKLTVAMKLKQDSALILTALTFPNQQAAIYPASVVKAAGDQPIKSFIGTGPFKFDSQQVGVETTLSRFADYKPRTDAPSGMAGKRVADVDHLVFKSIPEASVRLDNVTTGAVQIADSLDSDLYSQITSSANVVPTVTKPYEWPTAIFNKSEPPFDDVKVRQAFLAALNMGQIMQGAFSSDKFYQLDSSIMAPQFKEWWSDAGSQYYNHPDPARAKQLLAESGYHNQPIVWLTTRDYPYMYTIAETAAQQLKAVGFNIKLDVVDFATIGTRRAVKTGWNIFSTALGDPDPGADAYFSDTAPGWWVDAHKDALVSKLNSTMDPTARKKVWDELQLYFWQQVPLIKFGDIFSLGAVSKTVSGYTPALFPVYWNVSVKK